MAAQFLLPRGRTLGNKYCSTLPNLVASRITESPPPRLLSTNPDLETEPPPPKRRPQPFVQPEIDLELGELETRLPPGYHQTHKRRQRGTTKPRHKADGRDSYWRPPWKNPRAEIVSAEDFANRPRVTFSESFASLQDAMLVLSWMPQEDKDGMYRLYMEMMLAIAEQQGGEGAKGPKSEGKDLAYDDWSVLSAHTSHEYVVRVVAQKYNVTTSRAAGVIQLQHNEEQLKKDPTFKVNYALQAHVDGLVRESIRQVYRSYGEKDPLQFVEDPIASTADAPRVDADSPVFVGASELMDVDAWMKKTRLQELEKAKVRIDNHIYVEDVDERSRRVKLDTEATKLLKMQAELGDLYKGMDEGDGHDENGSEEMKEGGTPAVASNDDKGKEENEAALPTAYVRKKFKKPGSRYPMLAPVPAAVSPLPENGAGHNGTAGTRRPRWKYAAQIINTHALENPSGAERRGKGVARKAKGRRHGRIVDGNTIIEQDGKLRAASVAELEQTSWKNVRNESEFMFKGVKEAWLRRQLEGEVGGWGIQEEVNLPKEGDGKDSEGGDAKGEGVGGEAGAIEGEPADEQEDSNNDKS